MGPLPELPGLKWIFYLAIIGVAGILSVIIKCGFWIFEHVRFV